MLKYLAVGTATAVAGGAWWARTSQHRLARLVRMLTADARRRIEPAPMKLNPAGWSDRGITLGWLGHATVLINFHGIWILTDPVFSNRVGVSVGLGTAGPKRYVAPALKFNELPPVDVVLLSHAHMDHMDLATLNRFSSAPFAVTATLTQDILADTPFRQATELRWGERISHRCGKGELEIEAFEVKHWGRRWPSELDRGYNGCVLRREGKALLFGGDTAMTPLFAAIRSKGPFEAAIMPIAAYRPWIRNHCTPEEAVAMANQAGARYFVPVHHETFKLSDEPMSEPIERLEKALERERERLALRHAGDSFVLPQT